MRANSIIAIHIVRHLNSMLVPCAYAQTTIRVSKAEDNTTGLESVALRRKSQLVTHEFAISNDHSVRKQISEQA